MGISNDSKKLIQDKLRSVKLEKKKILVEIQQINAQKDALLIQRDLILKKIENLEADLGK